MKLIHFPFILCLACYVPSLYANDPFDKNQRANKLNFESAPTNENCHQQQDAIFPESPFKQLKVIGILHNKNNQQLLLSNDEHQVSIAQIGDFVGQERLKIERIEQQQIHLLSWQNAPNCQQGQALKVKF